MSPSNTRLIALMFVLNIAAAIALSIAIVIG